VESTDPGTMSLFGYRISIVKKEGDERIPFTGQERSIEAQIARSFDDSEICRNTISHLK